MCVILSFFLGKKSSESTSKVVKSLVSFVCLYVVVRPLVDDLIIWRRPKELNLNIKFNYYLSFLPSILIWNFIYMNSCSQNLAHQAMNRLWLKYKIMSRSCVKLSINYGAKQVVTAALQNARQQAWVSWVLRDDHFDRIPCVTVGVTRWRTSLLNGDTFTGNGDVSIWVNSSTVGFKSPYKQNPKLFFFQNTKKRNKNKKKMEKQH